MMFAYFVLRKTGIHFFKVTFIYTSTAVYVYPAAKFWIYVSGYLSVYP